MTAKEIVCRARIPATLSLEVLLHLGVQRCDLQPAMSFDVGHAWHTGTRDSRPDTPMRVNERRAR